MTDAEIVAAEIRAAEVPMSDALGAALDRLERDAERYRAMLDDEIALRLRELGGALPDENITAMTERVIAERDALRKALRLAREGYASEAATGLPVLPQWRERTMALIDEALKG